MPDPVAALARRLCEAYAPIAGADGWTGIEAFPIDKAAWLAVAREAMRWAKENCEHDSLECFVGSRGL